MLASTVKVTAGRHAADQFDFVCDVDYGFVWDVFVHCCLVVVMVLS